MKFSSRAGLLVAASLLAALTAFLVVRVRPAGNAPAVEPSGASPTGSGKSPADLGAAVGQSGGQPTGAGPTAEQKKIGRAMDKTMAGSIARSFVESIDRGDKTGAERFRSALISYKDVGREVVVEMQAKDSHLSDAAKAALKEISEHAQ
ncbi:MAG: hypothetical protein K8T20_17865 [Planctomycetes bacterium]|nr:hypothetical protein [Planctomycetota bacterium]